jgi:KDO2-lipid IV(A) lauroyltransferase
VLNLKIKTEQLRTTWLGRLLYYCIPNNKSVAYKNIEYIFQDHISTDQRKHLLISVYSHLITSLKELLLIKVLNEKKLESRVQIQGEGHFLAAAKKGRGVILLTGHFGNWELGSLFALSRIQGFEGTFHAIRKPLRFRWMETYLFKLSFSRKIEVIELEGALKKVSQALKKNDAIIFIMDQKAKTNPSTQIHATFLEKKASIYASMAQLVKKYDCPVIPITSYRVDNKNHMFEFFEEIPWDNYSDHKEAITQNTLKYVRRIEKLLLDHPDQWIWNYKRWNW